MNSQTSHFDSASDTHAMRAALFERYAVDSDLDLAAAVVETLRSRGLKLAVAESCTGGLLSELITRVPGASQVFVGGVVAYSTAMKSQILGVSEQILTEKGAVSSECARAMAEGIRKQLKVEISVGVTGIAGPDGATPDKPVGTIFFCILGPDKTVERELHLDYNREANRLATAFEVFQNFIEF
jgi:nicotinamide-nucleotide amidase